MNRLLLTLAILISVGSLHGMEKEFQLNDPFIKYLVNKCDMEQEVKSSPMTLSQLYYYFSHDVFVADVAQHIFSLQCGNVAFAKVSDKLKQNDKDPKKFVAYIETLITSYGYLLACELCECFFKDAPFSVCDIKDFNGVSCFHESRNVKVAQILIKIAGDNAWQAISMQNCYGATPLHHAVIRRNISGLASREKNTYTRIIKLLLDTAGEKAQDLILMQNGGSISVLDYRSSSKRTKKVLQSYMANNKSV